MKLGDHMLAVGEERAAMQAEIDRLRAALRDIADGMGEDDPRSIGLYAPGVARAALGEKP